MQTPVSRITPDSSQQSPQATAPKPNLLDQARIALCSRHYSRRTEQTYCLWMYISFHLSAIWLRWRRPMCRPFSIFHLQFIICH